eukprot:snap_masked-scaffold_50-processed-gene-0.15-mRNA-1 protein AED:1.00 eAED:1.00 QI:0/0/0/0/1/1/5/0/453
MVKRPIFFVTVFVITQLVLCSVLIKIFEQEFQQDFKSFSNALWFAFVTASTVGFGDLTVFLPVTFPGRLVTGILMLIGIGLFSTLSAFTMAGILAVEKAETAKEQMKKEFYERLEFVKKGLVNISEPYNPISSIFYKVKGLRSTGITPHAVNISMSDNSKLNRQASLSSGGFPGHILGKKQSEEAKQAEMFLEKIRSTALSHESSVMNPVKYMDAEIKLPLEKVLDGAGGKFKVNKISTYGQIIRENYTMQVKQSLEKVGKKSLNERSRLKFLLSKYDILQGSSQYRNFVAELNDIIFAPIKRNGLYIEKMYAIKEHTKKIGSPPEHLKDFPYIQYDFQDPLYEILVDVDELCQRYNVNKKLNYCTFITEIKIMCLLLDRVKVVEFAADYLQLCEGIFPPKPLYEDMNPPYVKLPAVSTIIVDEENSHLNPIAAETRRRNRPSLVGSFFNGIQ